MYPKSPWDRVYRMLTEIREGLKRDLAYLLFALFGERISMGVGIDAPVVASNEFNMGGTSYGVGS